MRSQPSSRTIAYRKRNKASYAMCCNPTTQLSLSKQRSGAVDLISDSRSHVLTLEIFWSGKSHEILAHDRHANAPTLAESSSLLDFFLSKLFPDRLAFFSIDFLSILLTYLFVFCQSVGRSEIALALRLVDFLTFY